MLNIEELTCHNFSHYILHGTSIYVDCVFEILCKLFKGVQVMEIVNMKCNSLSQIHSIAWLFQAENSIAGS